MKSASKTIAVKAEPDLLIRSAAFWLSIFLLISVPLGSSAAVHRIFSLPKYAILLVGSSALVPLIALAGLRACRNEGLGLALRSKHVLIASLYSISIVVSTIFSVAPMASIFGSFENQMGLMTRLCFFVCFLSLIVGIAKSRARLEQAIWAMAARA